jgi:putative lipase involved disintegration of autophagic bodies
MTTTTEYALMAGNAYRSTTGETVDRTPIPNGWEQLPQPLGYRPPDASGFEATAYQKGNEIVISFAGIKFTDLTGDWLTNIALGIGLGYIDRQLKAAAEFYETIKNNLSYQGATITFTGHSLGDGLRDALDLRLRT